MKFALERNVSNHRVIQHGGFYSNRLQYDSGFMDFSSNVNPLGFPSSITKIINKNRSLFSVYPDSDSSKLRDDLQKYTGIKKNQIIVGNGATEIIYNFCKVFLHKYSNVLIPVPTFGEYEVASRLSGSQITFFKTMNLNKNISELQDLVTKTNCIFVCNPNNPTGVLLSKNNLLKILESAYNKSVLMFLDECFIELVPNSNESLVRYLKEFDNLFILRSLTKSFGLAGLRIGYGLGNKKVIDVLQRIKIPWNVNGLAQMAASEALSNISHLDKTRKLIKKELKFLNDSISKINGFICYDSSTNFILIKSKMNSKKIQEKLIEKKILVRDCSNFRGLDNKFIRVAVRTHKENVKLVRALEEI
ncbi:MAG TPA: threonine-phosphate decarboxylase CobD [Nitrosopumilaceae archaeon]|nr:threonine-phosphate decarboxylase CobD [Nitrosopumilaceae archaeon]